MGENPKKAKYFPYLLTCDRLDIETIGFEADNPRYSLRTLVVWYLREIPTTALAWWKLVFIPTNLPDASGQLEWIASLKIVSSVAMV